MHAHVDTKLVPLTRSLAVEFSTMQAAAGERPWRPSRDKWIRSLIDRGEFFTPKWAFCWLGNQKIRLNGQHSSAALASIDEAVFPHKLKVVVDEFVCDTEQDVAILFEHFDAGESSRSRDEMIAAHARSEHDLDNVASTKIRKIVDGIAWGIGITDSTRLDKHQRSALTHTHQQFILFAEKFANDKTLALAAVMGAIYRTWKVCDVTADCFWELVMNESHVNKDHPTRALSRWLRSTRFSTDEAKGTARKSYTPTQIHERCIHQWNAFRNGRETVKQVKGYTNKTGGVVAPI